MRFVDEENVVISDNGTEPDWSVWTTDYVEECENEDGTFEVIRHCRQFTEEEIRQRTEAELQRTMTEQTPFALQLFVMQADLADEQALQVSAFYPEWKIGNNYKTGDICRYDSDLYRALQDSTAAAEHTPDVATSLWKKIEGANESGVFPWSQPLGATDAYSINDRVTHNGKTWISEIDNNVWEPGVYGWKECVDESS